MATIRAQLLAEHEMAESNLLLSTKLESALGNEQTLAVKLGVQLHTYEKRQFTAHMQQLDRCRRIVSNKNATKPNQGAFKSHDRNNANPTRSMPLALSIIQCAKQRAKFGDIN